jgi:hypothetical protein
MSDDLLTLLLVLLLAPFLALGRIGDLLRAG